MIPDLHGHLQTHDRLFHIIEQEIAEAPHLRHIAVYLGDYVDRGPDSKGLIDRLIAIKAAPPAGLETVFLAGNHERGLLGFLESPHGWANWLDYGGLDTLQSYGLSLINTALILPAEREEIQLAFLKTLPSSHYEFLSLLQSMYILGDYAFVHAGIQPGVPLGEQDERDLMMIRQPFLSWPHPHEKCIVHGHTIISQPEVLMNRIGLDTGLYQGGLLSCAVLEDNKVRIQQLQRLDGEKAR